MRTRRTVLAVVAALVCSLGPVGSASPPDFVNYQGVLRGADGTPRNGPHDIVFRFWSLSVGGSEILIDSHTAASGGAVTVSNGLFDVMLGGGVVSDGAGAGSYTSLASVFRDYAEVWLEIRVGAETLTPRVRLLTTPYAANAGNLGGMAPSLYLNTLASNQAKLGSLVVGQASFTEQTAIEGHGVNGGGYFRDTNASGRGWVGYGDYAFYGYGSAGGAYLGSTDGFGLAILGNPQRGVEAYGVAFGGMLADRDHSGLLYGGIGDRGLWAYGSEMGGAFEDLDSTGLAYLAVGDYGVQGQGSVAGGYFGEIGTTATAYLAYADYGIRASGGEVGGYFTDTNSSGKAYVAYGDVGVSAYGNSHGGYFKDLDHSGLAYVGYGDRGIWAKGLFAGGTFSHPDNTTYWSDVALVHSGSTYKIRGTGLVSFAQNHPYDRNKLIVYAAPEGDEAAVYTRGSARLTDGEARIALGETFAWVANPDVGLTAHLTPRGQPVALAVVELTTREMVVHGADGSNASFDYIVYGLRLGCEQHSPVQIKDREAFLPSQDAVAEFYALHPELRRFSALERFQEMRTVRGEAGPADLSRTRALIAAVDANRAEVLAAARPVELSAGPREATAPPVETGSDAAVVDTATWMRVDEAVDAGDLLALDPTRPGVLRRAAALADPGVFGIAAGPSRVAADGTLEAPLSEARYATLKVDAGYGAIRPGDALAASPTPGHAMRMADAVPAVVVGRAAEDLDSGTGTVLVLVVLR